MSTDVRPFRFIPDSASLRAREHSHGAWRNLSGNQALFADGRGARDRLVAVAAGAKGVVVAEVGNGNMTEAALRRSPNR
jgi:hypothetical protein